LVFFFGSLYNVQQERILRILNKEQPLQTWDERVSRYLGISIIQCLSALGTFGILFWLDLLPWFGSASNIHTFDTSVRDGLRCFFGINTSCDPAWKYGIVFNVGYIVSFLAALILNETDAPYTLIQSIICAPIVVGFWLIFPHLNPSPEKEPIFLVIPALLIGVIGMGLYKHWQYKVQHSPDTITGLLQSE